MAHRHLLETLTNCFQARREPLKEPFKGPHAIKSEMNPGIPDGGSKWQSSGDISLNKDDIRSCTHFVLVNMNIRKQISR